jgi:hypothetical protein
MDRWDLLSAASMLASTFVAIIIAFVVVLSGKQWRAAQEQARARRIAEYKLNARLLRLNI